jgi:HK97 family phage major capsid protein
MNEFLKFLKSLKAKGFATASEKAKVATMLKELESDEQETVADDVAEVEALADTDPADDAKVDEVVEKAFNKAGLKIEKGLDAKLEKAVADMKSDVEAWLKSQKDKINAGVGSEESTIKAKHDRMNKFLKGFANAILSGDDAKAKEMTTDKTGSPFAGYAVDSELSAEIRALTTVYGVARREFFATPLSKNAYEANALATDVTVGWVTEAGVIGSTQIVLGQEELKLKKLGAIVSLTRELIEDEEVDLFSFIATRVAQGFALSEDRAFFIGTGAGDTTNGEFTGITQNASVPVVNLSGALSTLTVEKLYDTMDALPQGAQAGAKWYGHRSIKSKVRLLKDGASQYVYLDPINNAGLPSLLGKPFVEVEAMTPAGSVASTDGVVLLYGDLKKSSIMGYKSGIVADRFNAGVIKNVAGNADINLITTDREAIRFISRVGAITILPTACVVLATQAGS